MEKRLSYREFVKYLRKHFPSKKPVHVRRCITPFDKSTKPFKRVYGMVYKQKHRYLILLSKSDPVRVQKDTLLHEWAHCIAKWKNDAGHTRKWGIVYARIYRKMCD